MTDLHKDIWQQIEEQRANYQRIINAATDTINNARRLIADAREGMDSLPVAKTRRARKGEVTVEGMTAVIMALDASLKADEGEGEVVTLPELRLPGAAELFPHGIERIRDGEEV